MNQTDRAAITPSPTDEEAAAIVAALSAFLDEHRAPTAAPHRPTRAWAMAGRLTSQGRAVQRRPGRRVTWGNSGRVGG